MTPGFHPSLPVLFGHTATYTRIGTSVPLLRTCIAEVPLQEGICRVVPGKPLAVKKGIGMVIFQSPNEKQGGTRDVSADGVLLPLLLSHAMM